jgi:hypothetical protein
MKKIPYPVIYAFYRILAITAFLLMAWYAVILWLNGQSAIFALTIQIIVAAFWGLVLWGCPNMMSGVWEQSISQSVWNRRPSLWLTPFLAFSLIGYGFGMFILSFFTVAFLYPVWIQLALAIAMATTLLTVVPMTIGVIRIFVRMRRAGSTTT